MKVLHLCDSALSGAPYRLMQVQRLGGLDARHVLFPDPAAREDYPHDVAADGDPGLIADLLAAADVVHYHNRWRRSEIFALHPWAWELVRRKPAVIQFHSPRDGEDFEEALREPSLLKLVVAQYHVRFYPECRPVPNAVPIDDPLHRPLGRYNDPPVVAFTPQKCGREGWHDKGCAPTLEVLRRGFRHRFVTGASWREAMELRAACDIAIDEIVTGSYHLCSLEALSQGLATVAGLDAQTVDALERVTGTREHPWIVARPETLERELACLVEDAGYLRDRREAARRYMERYWSPAAVTAQFRAVYEEALAHAD